MDALGAAGTAYRTRVYAGFSGERVTGVGARTVQAFLDVTRSSTSTPRCGPTVATTGCSTPTTCWTCATGGAGVGRLQEMLEGQVAVLSSGLLSPAEALELLAGAAAERALPRRPAQLPCSTRTASCRRS